MLLLTQSSHTHLQELELGGGLIQVSRQDADLKLSTACIQRQLINGCAVIVQWSDVFVRGCARQLVYASLMLSFSLL